jgi:hypothetical protein
MTEHPANPPLTRRQLREIRNTGATPVVTAEAADAARAESASNESPTNDITPPGAAASGNQGMSPHAEGTPEADSAAVPVAAVRLPRPVEPDPIADAPAADSAVDLGVAPLTRRQARQQERIRTAAVPVITPDLLGGAGGSSPALPVSALGYEAAGSPIAVEERSAADAATEASGEASGFARDGDEDQDRERATVSPKLGQGLLEAEAVQVDLPPSFDQLLSRGPASTSSTPHALIVSQTPAPQIMAPVNATGEVIITGMLNLPDGLGSTGHAPGTADGKDVDAVLVDGELPAHSSPTPIAASAAISTVKLPGEIIQPPAPERGSRLMLALAITAGALALALVGVLILAFVSGVFA